MNLTKKESEFIWENLDPGIIGNLGDKQVYAAFCLRTELNPDIGRVMTKAEFSKHLDQVIAGQTYFDKWQKADEKEKKRMETDEQIDKGVYCNCIYYDNAHRIVETENEKIAWNFMNRAYHQRDYFYQEIPGSAKLVARPSRWGSPFKLKDYTLEESLNLYHNWLHEKLDENPKFLDPLKRDPAYVKEGDNPFWVLVCYCPPSIKLDCHARIILQHLWGECKK